MTSPAPTRPTVEPDVDPFVYMTHPDIEAPPAQTTTEAFDGVWKVKGWKLLNSEKVTAARDDVSAGAVALSSLTKAELVDRGRDLGLDLKESSPKDDLVAAITNASVA